MSGETDPRRQVALALQALEVAPTGLTWFGRRVARAGDPGGDRPALVAALADLLYRDFYSAGTAVPSTAIPKSPPAVRAALRERLCVANSGSVTWAPGWRVNSIRDDEVRVERSGLELVVGADELEPGRAVPEVGERVTIALPAELMGISPGYYVATGEAGDGGDVGAEAVRVYFNITTVGAAELVAVVTETLNRRAIPFRMKILDDPLLFSRCDAALIAVPRRLFSSIAEPLRRVIYRIEEYLASPVPVFTKRLCPGVGLAEDPEWKGGSFGAHRCRLVAEGVMDAAHRGEAALEARLQAVEASFAHRGLRLTAPHLNRGSPDAYRL